MKKKLTDAEIDLSNVRDQFVVKRNKLNRVISDYEARVNECVIAINKATNSEEFNRLGDEAEKNRQAVRQLRRLRLDTEAEINAIVVELNRLAEERREIESSDETEVNSR